MTWQRAGRLGWLAWGLCGTCVVLLAFGFGFLLANDGTVYQNTLGSPTFDALFNVAYLAFPIVGALIASREPRNPIGWLLLATGVGRELEWALLGWATHTLVAEPGSLPAGALAGLVADLTWVPTVIAGVAMIFLLFPDGRLPTPRWRPALWLAVLFAAAYVLGTALKPGPLYYFPATANPLGVDRADSFASAVVDAAGFAAIGLVLVAIASLVVRFRRSRGQERQQLKWLAYAAALLAVSTPVQPFLDDVEVAGLLVSDFVFVVLICLLPVAIGAAILRHRLYDIDLVIRRTLVYGALTATLVAAYLGSVLLAGLAVGQSGLAVAASTLAVAALARPALSRIQALVDRRFYRRRYDASHTLEAFGARLRDELDLETLGADLREVVTDTVQPTHVSLWLRSAR